MGNWNDALAELAAWAALELLLTGLLLAAYSAVRRLAQDPRDRYRFLKLTFASVLFVPFVPSLIGAALSFLAAQASSGASVATSGLRIVPFAGAEAPAIPAWIPLAALAIYALLVTTNVTRILASHWKLSAIAGKAQAHGMRCGIPVLVTDADVPPATFGWLSPVILMPRRVLDAVSPEELEMILRHEELHVLRRDYLFNLMRAVVQGVLSFSPFMPRLGRAFVEEMELSCDALVLGSGAATPHAYGGLLLKLGTNSSPRKDLVYSGLFASPAFLTRRIHAMQAQAKPSRKLVPVAVFALFALVAGPALTSLGVGAKVEEAVRSAAAANGNEMVYRFDVVRKNKDRDSVSGTLRLEDKGQSQIRAGQIAVTVTTLQDGENWKVNIHGYDERNEQIVWDANIITTAQIGARVDTRSDDVDGDDDPVGMSFNLSPLVKAKPAATAGVTDAGEDKIVLKFEHPVEIKNVIKTLAQLSGKSVILDRDVDGKVTVVSDGPMRKADAYQAMLGALDQVGVKAVEEGKVVRLSRKAP